MRALYFGLSLVAGLAVAAASAATQPAGFPRDEVSLRALDSQQLRIVRRAGAQCWHSGEAGFRSRGVRSRACVIGATEGAIRGLDDAQLQAFHQALPFNARYDEYRPALYWQRLVVAN